MWRWDQGRLTYFQFDNLKQIAKILVQIEGIQLNLKGTDPLRDYFQPRVDLPFLPDRYKIWRNYKRVFECCFLATSVDNRLVVTDVCKKVAGLDAIEIDVDEYFSLVIPRFCFPFPGFQGYNHQIAPVYPFCSILKYLIAQFKQGNAATIDEEQFFSMIVGNHCDGTESIDHYARLNHTGTHPQNDQKRQVREMLIFLSQFSILKWYNRRLYLDISKSDLEQFHDLVDITTPIIRTRKALPTEEFLSMTSVGGVMTPPTIVPSREIPTEEIFTEGKRVRTTHLKIERSPILRRLFFQAYPEPICNMCVCNTKERYPWTDNLLEIHHMLPLSSTLAITTNGTSLEDVVALCPTCHRATHDYYKNWLNSRDYDDFQNKTQAKDIYEEARCQIRL